MGRDRSGGFALPLALIGASGLLLGSLALQSAGMASRRQTATGLRLRQAEDRLASAAHRLVGTISRRHGCLLGLPQERWADLGQPCVDAAALAGLQQWQGPEGRLRLISWQLRQATTATPAEVELLLEASPATAPAAAAEPLRRAAFAFTLAERPLRPLDLRGLGLRGQGR